MIDKKFIDSVVSYNPETGSITWKMRDESDLEMLKHFTVRSIRGFNSRFAGKEAGTELPLGYKKIYFSCEGQEIGILAHHVAWIIMTGKFPEDIIDHKDRNPKNNKWENLREVSRVVNNLNTKVRKDSVSKVKGVNYRPKRKEWIVSFFVNGKTREIFRSKDFFEAVCVRKSLDAKYDLEHSKDDRKVIKSVKPFSEKLKPNKAKVRQLPSGNFQAYAYVKNTETGKKVYLGLGTYSDYFEACCVSKSFDTGTMYDRVKYKVVKFTVGSSL